MMTRPGVAEYNPPGRAAGNPSGLDVTITSLAELAAVVTVGFVLPVIKQWVQASDGTYQVWQAYLSSAATGDGVQRSDDWSDSGIVWFRASS